jgi:hypothetical protein
MKLTPATAISTNASPGLRHRVEVLDVFQHLAATRAVHHNGSHSLAPMRSNVTEPRVTIRTFLQWTEGAGPPSFTLRSVSASGTAASEISISTQNASM